MPVCILLLSLVTWLEREGGGVEAHIDCVDPIDFVDWCSRFPSRFTAELFFFLCFSLPLCACRDSASKRHIPLVLRCAARIKSRGTNLDRRSLPPHVFTCLRRPPACPPPSRASYPTRTCNRRNATFLQKRVTSPGPLVHEWLAAVAQGGDSAAATAAAAADSEGASLPPLPQQQQQQQQQQQWPWLLVVVDIYGRAGRWAAAAEAFDSFLSSKTSASFGDDEDHLGSASASVSASAGSTADCFTRLPMPDELGGGGGGGSVSAPRGELSTAAAALPPGAWASLPSSALAHATTSYLKLGMAEEAAEVLSFLKAGLGVVSAPSSTAAAAAPAPDPAGLGNGSSSNTGSESRSGLEGEGGDGRRRDCGMTPPVGSSDPAWIEGTIRGFARLGGWDLAPAVLSPEIVGWVFSSEAGVGAGITSGGSGSGSGSGRGDGRLALAFESLEAFLESKLMAKRPAAGQVDGARACLELLRACRAGGAPEGDEQALVYAEALRWLSSPAQASTSGDGGDVAAGASKTAVGEQKDAPPPVVGAATRERFGDDYRAILRSRCESLPQEAVLRAIGRAWGATTEGQHAEEGGVRDAATERRRLAAFALYEAGVEANALPADGHWTSQSAGVLSLNYREYQMQDGAPLAALHLVLSDMRRKYAYEEPVSETQQRRAGGGGVPGACFDGPLSGLLDFGVHASG